jgi:radical SAM protein with 4Fe4S-binding SPASM domain
LKEPKPLRRVKSDYNPPSLIFKQAFSLISQGWLTHWAGLPRWLLKGKKVISTAAGATAIGCTGYPYHVVWEITNRCNLNCIHCYASSVESPQNEITTLEGKRLLDQIASMAEFRMIVVTGGEPLLRPDIFELMEYAGRLGFRIIFSTNGTLLTQQIARDLVKSGVVNFSISLDGSTQQSHEKIRRIPGCFDKTIEGLYAASATGICVQINFTAMKQNLSELPLVIDLAESLKVDLFMVFQSIPPCQERGAVELGPEEQLHLLEIIREKQRKCRFLIMPVCSPEYWPLIAGQNGKNHLQKRLLQSAFSGCGAGRGFCYVRFDGDVWPCNFIPIAAGNIRYTSLQEIWRKAPLLEKFRNNHRALKNECGNCAHNPICGGCRGRAFAHHGDYLASDPNCTLMNNGFNHLSTRTF